MKNFNEFVNENINSNVDAVNESTAPIAIVGKIRKNIMGTASFDLKIKGMNKSQDFIVYPSDSKSNEIMIQSDTRIGRLDMITGKGRMSKSHPSGAYGVHLSIDKLTEFQLSPEDLTSLSEFIKSTRGASVGNHGVTTDNSAAGVYEASKFKMPDTKSLYHAVSIWLTKKNISENQAKWKSDDIKKDIACKNSEEEIDQCVKMFYNDNIITTDDRAKIMKLEYLKESEDSDVITTIDESDVSSDKWMLDKIVKHFKTKFGLQSSLKKAVNTNDKVLLTGVVDMIQQLTGFRETWIRNNMEVLSKIEDMKYEKTNESVENKPKRKKSFFSFMDSYYLDKIPLKIQKLNLKELEELLLDQETKYNRMVSMRGYNTLSLRDFIWNLKSLISAHKQADEYNKDI